MKSDKNILIAFILNLSFSIFEFVGGTITNSVAIISDSIHDMGDSLSIGVAYFLEKLSKRKPDDKYTYGYIRYSVMGSLISTLILVVGSIFVIYNAVKRIFNPVAINYDGMIIFAIFGVVINFIAAYVTKGGHSLNQSAVSLHMFEDVLGWIVVLIGAIVMRFTDINVIDSVLSIIVALFIMKHAFIHLKSVVDLFMEKIPDGVDIEELQDHLLDIKGVKNVHHIHVWSIDGYNNYATMHVVCDGNYAKIKKLIKEEMIEHNICHTTVEIESLDEECFDDKCVIKNNNVGEHHHHHH